MVEAKLYVAVIVVLAVIVGVAWASRSYERTIRTDIPADELWQLLEEGLQNSSASPVWPEMERTHARLLEEGEIIEITYLAVESERTIKYEVVERNGRRVVFEDMNGELAVRAELAVEEEGDGGVVVWKARFAKLSLTSLYARWVFEPRFFDRLEENLRRYEG